MVTRRDFPLTGKEEPQSHRNPARSISAAAPFERPSVPGGKPAVFLDRDGTIIEHVHYCPTSDKCACCRAQRRPSGGSELLASLAWWSRISRRSAGA